MHIKRRAHLAGKPVERFFALLRPWIERRWGSKPGKAAGCGQELMTKAILVEDTVQIGPKHATISADASVWFVICQFGEGFGLILIKSLSNVDLVSGNQVLPDWLAKQRMTVDDPGTEAGHFV